MKTTKHSFEVQLQASLLHLGRMLSDDDEPHGRPGRISSTPPHDAISAEVERILSLVRKSAVAKFFGIQKSVCVDDPVRLKTVALLGWQMVGAAISYNPLADVAANVLDPNRGPYCEQMLITRDCIARMVCEGLLTVTFDQGNNLDGRLLLPARTYSWFCGGDESKGDFSAAKIIVGRLSRAAAKQGDKPSETAPLNVPTAKQLYAQIRADVLGLDPQVRVLSSRIALHVARADYLKSGANDNAVGNTVVLLAGSSGSGKTFLVERTANAAVLPFCQIDSTTLTASGYVGSDVDEIYKLLVNSTGGNVVAASRGLCFLDEFDKKAACYNRSGSDSRDIGGEAVQMELLAKLQAGSTPFVVGGKRSDGSRPFLFDGRPTGYILGGIFSGLEAEIEKCAGRNNIGFASQTGGNKHVRLADCLKELGFLDELVNRIGLILRLPDPTVENVMRAASGGLLCGFNAVLASKKIALVPTTVAIRAIAEYAMETKGFYRSAKAVLATIAEEALFDPPAGKKVYVGREDVRRATERLATGFVVEADRNTDGGSELFGKGELDTLEMAETTG